MVKASALSIRKSSEPVTEKLELVCPAHNLTSLKAAVENGANSVHIEYRAAPTHPLWEFALARDAALKKGIRYAHEHKVQIVLSFSQLPAGEEAWTTSTAMIRDASNLGVDAVVLSDPALMLYTAAHYPRLAIHYAVPQPAIEAGAIKVLIRNIPIARIILPRVVSVAHIEDISRISGIGVELVGFGRTCSILTPRAGSPITSGALRQPAASNGKHDESFLVTAPFHAVAGRCATPEEATNDQLFQHAHCDEWHALNILPHLAAIHVRALRIELQDSSSSKLARLTRVWREAIDECLHDTQHYSVHPAWLAELKRLAAQT